jgi:hypothetical protein
VIEAVVAPMSRMGFPVDEAQTAGVSRASDRVVAYRRSIADGSGVSVVPRLGVITA